LHKEFDNDSLECLSRRVTEHNTADLLLENKEVFYSYDDPGELGEYREIGLIQLCEPQSKFPYTIEDVSVVNDIFNYNLYFQNNTEPTIQIPSELEGTFDILISLAAGDMPITNSEGIEFDESKGTHYIIDISPTAIHKTMGLYKKLNTKFQQLDIFNMYAFESFLSSCEGNKGFINVSNCFNYIVNALIYDVNYRLKIQNDFIEVLANDNKEWYVTMYSADGTHYQCVKAEDIRNKKLDERFKVLPWIK